MPMFARRLGALSGLLLAVAFAVGSVQAGAAKPTRVLRFNDPPGIDTGIGFDFNSNVTPPVGSHFVIAVRLENATPQFGKPAGATVGRALLDCTVLAEPTSEEIDGNCVGIAHVPDGFVTFDGWPFAGHGTQHYAITGGVGPYAAERGQITSVDQKNGRSLVTVSLYS
jgi:hypothetical protein